MKIAILGAAGRMGQMLCNLASQNPEFESVVKCDIVDGYEKTWPEDTDAVIDFTFHSAVPANIARAVETKSAYVLGTTGLTAEEEQAVTDAATKIPVVKSANMSLGVNLLLDLVRRAAAVLGADYDIEVVEMHHRLKKDAPSGTALMLANAAADGRNVKLEDVACYGREGLVGERPEGEIALHALRGGSVVGDHTVMYASNVERIEITHKAQSREAFAAGALRAAIWAKGKDAKIYSMRDVLNLND